ncbi:MAG: sigma-54-dependent Fis family transcriptional regulator, partial [Planctomycetes bacterium]|nr:sigma-54-dependent Fis family transcriptional regulator [Planctomycetota bacterium]
LRDRRQDIPLLAEHFLKGYTHKYRKAMTGFEASVTQALRDYPWPGNVRELDHAIERAVLMARGSQIELCDLGLQSGAQDMPAFESMTLEALELWALKKALERCPDISKAAEALGLSRGALYRRLEKYDIRV